MPGTPDLLDTQLSAYDVALLVAHPPFVAYILRAVVRTIRTNAQNHA